MTERALFNRRYTSYSPNGTEVWLLNGAGVQTTPTTTTNFLAGVDLNQGSVVFVSGAYVVPAVASLTATRPEYTVIGITTESASQNATVSVSLDDSVTIPGSQVTAESSLTPGEVYYLSKYQGELSKYSNASGIISNASGYSVLAPVGVAVSEAELQVEIATPIVLND